MSPIVSCRDCRFFRWPVDVRPLPPHVGWCVGGGGFEIIGIIGSWAGAAEAKRTGGVFSLWFGRTTGESDVVCASFESRSTR